MSDEKTMWDESLILKILETYASGAGIDWGLDHPFEGYDRLSVSKQVTVLEAIGYSDSRSVSVRGSCLLAHLRTKSRRADVDRVVGAVPVVAGVPAASISRVDAIVAAIVHGHKASTVLREIVEEIAFYPVSHRSSSDCDCISCVCIRTLQSIT